MCLIVLAYQTHSDFPLLVAANRDEFYARATENSRFWPDHPQLLAGRDLEAGGTWMGVTRDGRFAAITNSRDSDVTLPAPRSRGELTLNFLLGTEPPMDYLAGLDPHADQYAGYNLLLGDGKTLAYGSNRYLDEHAGTAVELKPGVYGLSNARLDTPWPKLELAKSGMTELLSRAPDHLSLSLLVSDRQLASQASLARAGLEDEMSQTLSAQFIKTEGYGTRATTTLVVDGVAGASWQERVFDESGEQVDLRFYELPR